MEQVLCMGGLCIVFLLSPYVIHILNRRFQDKCHNVENVPNMEGTGKYEMPKRIWVLTARGILANFTCFAVLLCVSLYLIRFHLPGIDFSEYASIYSLFWWTWALLLPLLTFQIHKDDYILVTSHKLEFSCGSHLRLIDRNRMTVLRKHNAFLIVPEDGPNLRIHRNVIRRFVNGTDLERLFDKLAA